MFCRPCHSLSQFFYRHVCYVITVLLSASHSFFRLLPQSRVTSLPSLSHLITVFSVLVTDFNILVTPYHAFLYLITYFPREKFFLVFRTCHSLSQFFTGQRVTSLPFFFPQLVDSSVFSAKPCDVVAVLVTSCDTFFRPCHRF